MTEPSWVAEVLAELSTVDSTEMFAKKTPFKTSAAPSLGSYDAEDDDEPEPPTAHELRVYKEIQRAAQKFEKDQYVWFKKFDILSPCECIPESVSDREKRVYVWHLLQSMFKKQKGAFISIRRYDIIAFLRQAWRTSWSFSNFWAARCISLYTRSSCAVGGSGSSSSSSP